MQPPTLRAQNKTEKLRRIRQAARDLFDGQGFDATSTREIAARANVGLATLFLYASDKRDLLFLAYNDDLEALTERAYAGVETEDALLDQLTSFFRQFFRFYGTDRRLSRDLLRELTFYTAGQQSARFQATRRTTIARIASLVGAARARGTVRCAASDEEAGQVIFYVFAAEVRRWLSNDLGSPEEGLADFAGLLRVVIFGLDADRAA